MIETLLEMPLAARLFIVFVVVVGLISIAAYVIHRAVRSRQLQRQQTLPLQVHSYSHGPALVFKILFWIHQVLLGLPSALIGLDLLLEGETSGVIAAIGLLLAWIGGTLVWGLAALMHQRTVYELPSVFDQLADNIARLETMQAHAGAVGAVADAVNNGSRPTA
jgi:hypothetical protein